MKTPAAMVFAAGFGTRMGKLTASVPKPMLPLDGAPMIDAALHLLRDAGIKRIVANTHYLRDVLEPHLVQQDVKISHEPEILETGGGLKAARTLLETDPVLTINPDAVWIGQNPVSQLLDSWREDMSALLLCAPTQELSDFEIFNGELQRGGHYRYTGVQLIRVSRLDEIDQDAFSLNLYWDYLMEKTQVHAAVYDGEWIDIGTPEGLITANRRLSA